MPSIRDTLTRLFSNDVVMSKSDDGEVQALDVNRMQAISTEYSSGRYKRMYQGGYSRSSMGMSGLGGGGYGHGGGSDQSMHRIQLFQDYESMDADPIIASALDVYADEIATEDEYGRLLQVECENGEIKGIIENLLFEILNVNMNLRWWARGMLKYGDFFMKLHIVDGGGVVNVTPLDVYMMAREQPETGAGQTMFYHEDVGEPWQQWEVAHFRLLSDSNFYPYGRAILENGRQIWKQLSLTEEAMLVHRIMRAPEKRVFKIDVGNISPDAIDSYMHQIIQDVQQTPLVDPQSGEYNLEFNLQNMLEDFYFPVRGDNTGTEVETLQGLDYQAIEDVEYLRKKLMSALRIPNAFLGYEQEIQGKSTLAQESLKFAENVRKLQKMMAAELEKIAAVHLIAKGYDVSDVTDFNIQLTDPSIIAEQERVDFLQKKIRVAGDAMDNKLFSSDYMMEHLFNMSEEEIIKERKRMVDDWKREFRKDQIEREGNDPVKTGRGFGTPSQLSDAGSTQLEPIAITGGGPESEGDDSNYGLRDLTPELGPDQSDVRPQYYQGGSPRAVNASKEKQKQSIITESLGLEEEFELRHEGSYMSLSAVEEIDETAADHILEELE